MTAAETAFLSLADKNRHPCGSKAMKLLSLFSGVGGLDSAVERAFNATCIAHCEADTHCRKVLARHWPGVPCFDDVRKLTAADVGPVDIVCGGFPCTDLSVAGKQVGMGGAKSGLWSEYLRLVRELRPSIVVIENVPPLYRKPEWRGQVEFPLAELGYRVLWTLCKASDAGAPHRRERTFALAILPGVRVPMLPTARVSAGDASLPTPAAMVPNDGESVETWEARRQTLIAKHGNSNGCGTPLSIAVQPWPTPRSEDSESSGAHRGVADTLTSAARRWPTPTRQYDMTSSGPNGNGGEYLLGAVQQWTTPTVRDRESPAKLQRGTGSVAKGNARTEPLGLQAQWPTPAASEARQGYQHRHPDAKGTQQSLTTIAVDQSPAGAGVLNPNWTEPLCGLPIGWTEAEGPPQQIDWAPKWPAGRGQPQHSWEPPRTLPSRTGKDRRRRLMAIGNIVVPQQAALALALLAATANDPTQSPFGRAQMVLL